MAGVWCSLRLGESTDQPGFLYGEQPCWYGWEEWLSTVRPEQLRPPAQRALLVTVVGSCSRERRGRALTACSRGTQSPVQSSQTEVRLTPESIPRGPSSSPVERRFDYSRRQQGWICSTGALLTCTSGPALTASPCTIRRRGAAVWADPVQVVDPAV